MDAFDKGRYVKADVTRSKSMIAAFLVSAFLGFLSGLLPGGVSFLGYILLFVVLIVGIYLIYRADHETKRKTDYLLVFFITLLSFLGFWILSLNIP